MPIPTEPCPYWYRSSPRHRWFIARIRRGGGGALLACHYARDPEGEWGARIPSSERIEAMEALISEAQIAQMVLAGVYSNEDPGLLYPHQIREIADCEWRLRVALEPFHKGREATDGAR